jgi:hypothetical protein
MIHFLRDFGLTEEEIDPFGNWHGLILKVLALVLEVDIQVFKYNVTTERIQVVILPSTLSQSSS